jgi:hypothetical protein
LKFSFQQIFKNILENSIFFASQFFVNEVSFGRAGGGERNFQHF